jgi:hypothetical protein
MEEGYTAIYYRFARAQLSARARAFICSIISILARSVEVKALGVFQSPPTLSRKRNFKTIGERNASPRFNPRPSVSAGATFCIQGVRDHVDGFNPHPLFRRCNKVMNHFHRPGDEFQSSPYFCTDATDNIGDSPRECPVSILARAFARAQLVVLAFTKYNWRVSILARAFARAQRRPRFPSQCKCRFQSSPALSRGRNLLVNDVPSY